MSFFFSSRRRHTRSLCDWSSDVCSSDLSLRGTHRADGGVRAERTVNQRVAVRVNYSANKNPGQWEAHRRRSEERRVGKECRSGGAQYREKKKEDRERMAQDGARHRTRQE